MSQSAAQAVLEHLAQAGVRPTGVSADSRQTQPGDLFLGWAGHVTDGRRFLAGAAERGACALLWDDSDGFRYTPPAGVVGFGVPRLRELAGWHMQGDVYVTPNPLPCGVIFDYPRFRHRGLQSFVPARWLQWA